MPKRNLIWLLVVTATAVLAVWFTRASQQSKFDRENGSASLAEACRLIEEHYYGPLDVESFKQNALTELVRQLGDPYSRYIPPKTAEILESRLSGKKVGLGLVVQRQDRHVRVVGVQLGSPAQKSPLALGDRILTIDDRSAESMKLDQMHQAFEVPIGQEVRISFQPPGPESQIQNISLTSGEYEVDSVAGLYRDGLGRWAFALDESHIYVAIGSFVPETPRRLRQACRLEGIEGMVLDLRGNPGGFLPSAIDTADMFLEEGPIVEVVSAGGRREVHRARSNGTLPPVDMVVLIDENSASGSELVAGALMRNARAVIVGTRSRGKGLVQSMLPLSHDQGLLHLTTAEFFLDGQAVHRRPESRNWGIEPDVPVSGDSARIDRLSRSLALLANVPPDRSEQVDLLREQQVEARIEFDAPLQAAIQLLENPDQLREILSRESRKQARRN